MIDETMLHIIVNKLIKVRFKAEGVSRDFGRVSRSVIQTMLNERR